MTGFEGGQVPLVRRLPKRGFGHGAFHVQYSVINVGELDARFDAKAPISPKSLHEAGLVKRSAQVKVLGGGDLKKAIHVQAHKFSASAKEKIEKAGGRVEVIAQ